MTTIALPPPATIASDSHFLLHGITWDFYETTIRELEAAGSNVRVTYDRGRMEFMSPSFPHEQIKRAIARLIDFYAVEKDIEYFPLGNVTCQRADLQRGIEPDECFYVQHMPTVTNKLDLSIDPPPDLAIEVEISRRSIARQPIYAALGIPEIWRYHDNVITILHRQPDGAYRPATASLAFPDLPIEIFQRYLDMALQSTPAQQRRVFRAFQKWVRQGTIEAGGLSS